MSVDQRFFREPMIAPIATPATSARREQRQDAGGWR